jgi:hypothetical protein
MVGDFLSRCSQKSAITSNNRPFRAVPQRTRGPSVQPVLTPGRQSKQEWSHLWIWQAAETELDAPRPMSNLLTPPGLIRSQKYVQGRTGDPIAQIYPMPSIMGAYMQTERGTRRLMPEETGRGLGVPKEWKIAPKRITQGLLARRTTSLFHWEYLSTTLSRKARPAYQSDGPSSLTWKEMRMPVETEHVPFSRKPPDLREGEPLHQA